MLPTTATPEGALKVSALQPVLTDASIQRVAHNGKNVMLALAETAGGFWMPSVDFDTMVAAYLLGESNVTIRGIAPGEYTVNVHYYESKNGQPVEVTVSIIKVNPRAEVVFYGQVPLARKGDEATAVRFTVLPDGTVANVNTLPKTLVQRL